MGQRKSHGHVKKEAGSRAKKGSKYDKYLKHLILKSCVTARLLHNLDDEQSGIDSQLILTYLLHGA